MDYQQTQLAIGNRVPMTAERRDAQLVSRVFGNIHLEHPEITREQVAERLRLRRKAEAANAATK